MMLSVLFAFQSAISEIRDELTMENVRRDKETGLSKSIKWMSCSDMFVAVDPLQRKAWQNFLGRLDEQTAQESRNQPSSNNAMTAPKTKNKQVLKSTAVFLRKKADIKLPLRSLKADIKRGCRYRLLSAKSRQHIVSIH